MKRNNTLSKKKCPKKIKQLLAIISTLLVLLYALLIFTNILWIKSPDKKKYPIRGVDVSHYQGNIDWEKLSTQNIHFAFIKATEGSKNTDEMFQTNWTNAAKTTLLIGAYHFFSLDSSGTTQAENFISHVPVCAGTLPPVIDAEFYGTKNKNRPSANEVHKQLDAYIKCIEEYYNCKPIIYTTYTFYNLYIKNNYDDCPIWIRNIYYNPSITPSLNWTFWQYSSSEMLEGYNGSEQCIDMNIYNGSLQSLKELCISSSL